MKKIRSALGALLILIVLGGAQACTESPTAPAAVDSTTDCWWLNGVLHCID